MQVIFNEVISTSPIPHPIPQSNRPFSLCYLSHPVLSAANSLYPKTLYWIQSGSFDFWVTNQESIKPNYCYTLIIKTPLTSWFSWTQKSGVSHIWGIKESPYTLPVLSILNIEIDWWEKGENYVSFSYDEETQQSWVTAPSRHRCHIRRKFEESISRGDRKGLVGRLPKKVQPNNCLPITELSSI